MLVAEGGIQHRVCLRLRRRAPVCNRATRHRSASRRTPWRPERYRRPASPERSRSDASWAMRSACLSFLVSIAVALLCCSAGPGWIPALQLSLGQVVDLVGSVVLSCWRRGSYFFWRSAKFRWPSLVWATATWKAMTAILAGPAGAGAAAGVWATALRTKLEASMTIVASERFIDSKAPSEFLCGRSRRSANTSRCLLAISQLSFQILTTISCRLGPRHFFGNSGPDGGRDRKRREWRRQQELDGL